MKPATGLFLALAFAVPAAARGLPEDIKVRAAGLPTSALVGGQVNGTALDNGRALLAANNPAQAISAFRIALDAAPQSVAALNGLAVAYDRLGRADLARQHFEMALALEPDAADIAYNLGLSLVHAGEDRAAIPWLQRAAAGQDTRAAGAARRTLVQIAVRLTAPGAPPAPAAPAAGPRIDIASSGEAVLVLAPVSARPASPPVAVAATVTPAVKPATTPAPAPAVQAAVEPALAQRLGDAAALTIPISLPTPTPEAPPAAAAAPLSTPRRIAAASPAQPAAPEAPSAPQPANVPVLAVAAPPRPVPVAAMLLLGRRTDPDDTALAAHRAPPISPPPTPPHDDKAAIRLAIARLEALLSVIEVHRG